MNLEIKKSVFKTKSFPFSLPLGIKKNPIKFENLSQNDNNKIHGKTFSEKEIYNYELEQSSENNDLANKLGNNSNIEKSEDNLINQLIQLKKNNNIFKNNMNEKNRYIKVFEKTKKYNLNKNEKMMNKNKDQLIKEYNDILSENRKIKKNMILQQILVNEMRKDIENLKLEKDKNKDPQFEHDQTSINGENNYQNILKEKNDLIIDLKNKNTKLINENKNLQEKLNKVYKENEENKLIDNLYKNILQISSDLDNINNKNNNFFFNSDFLKHINFEDNGNFTFRDKVNIINKCIDFIKSEIKILINSSKGNNNDTGKINNYNNFDTNFNELINSENGLNISKEKNKNSSNNFKFNNKLEKSLLTKYNNRYILSNPDLSLNEGSNNKMRTMLNNNRFNLKKKFLEKDGVIFKSNLISNSNNSLNDSKENIKTEINSRINKLINKNNSNLINKEASFFQNNKKLKIPIPKFQVNKTFNNFYPDNLNERSIKNDKNIPLKVNLNKNNKTKKQKLLNYSSYELNTNRENDRYKKSNLEHVKTDINNNNKMNKYDFEYIKLNVIFKNLNNSNFLSTEIKNTDNSMRDIKKLKKKKKFQYKYIKENC